jgi:hypothetical protein
MAHIDTTVAQLAEGDTIHLDGKARTVTAITSSDVPGYLNVTVTPGFDSKPFHWGAHWAATKIV